MVLEIANETHIDSILNLHSKYQIDSINEEDKKKMDLLQLLLQKSS